MKFRAAKGKTSSTLCRDLPESHALCLFGFSVLFAYGMAQELYHLYQEFHILVRSFILEYGVSP